MLYTAFVWVPSFKINSTPHVVKVCGLSKNLRNVTQEPVSTLERNRLESLKSAVIRTSLVAKYNKIVIYTLNG